ncbi:MAG: VWA-like domain-containing protein [Oscillospiraceae bacterium]|jgi:predicted metal-dependent peptidase|nr:VWA-like domain-containing protein [Oscillospiraceae bacterium]
MTDAKPAPDAERLRGYARRFIKARVRLIDAHVFYGLLLTHLIINIDDTAENVATDGERVFFNPDFLDALTDEELDFVLLHEVLHIALRHAERTPRPRAAAGKRERKRNGERFDEACDIVVNSNIFEELGRESFAIDGVGELPHLAPNGREGRDFTAEQLYDMMMLPSDGDDAVGGEAADKNANGKKTDEAEGDDGNDGGDGDGEGGGEGEGDGGSSGFDDHSRWGSSPKSDELRDEWTKNILDAARSIEIQQKNNSRGTIPAFAQRLLKQLRSNQLDWRTILNDFIQEEVNDYSFAPPDRRFSESPFMLPDFNEKDERVENILFMIDASGSMSDDAVSTAFAEIRSAVEQFGGKLRGLLGFFDAAISEPVPFEDAEELVKIKPRGGGGTDFGIIFDYVSAMDETPASVIILTDGYAPFPPEPPPYPVLWLINNENVTPPWGKTARINDVAR